MFNSNLKSRLIESFDRKVLILFYVLIIMWWVSIFVRGIRETPENYSFSLAYSTIPLIWGIIGFLNARRWGGFTSSVGKSVLFLSIGIFAWGIGNLIFAYYNLILHVPVPYPSLADAGFVLIYPFSAIGISYFFRTTGATFSLRKTNGKLVIFSMPIVLSVVSYYLLFVIARGGTIAYEGDLLKLVLDVSFPVGSVVVATLAALVYGLSVKSLGGLFRMPIIFILIGFLLNYLADFLFSYTTTTETYFVGMWIDLFYPTAFSFIGLGLSLMDPRLASRHSSINKIKN